MKEIIEKISSDQCLKAAEQLLTVAFSSQNMGIKYKLFQEANDIKKIAKILWKYEEMQNRGDK